MKNRALSCDVLVAGGGVAGVACALAAARLGARVVLCQDRPVLGGNASSEIRMHIVGATGLCGGQALESELREGGIVEELRLDQAVQNPQRSPSMMDLLLYDKCRREPQLELLLNTAVVAATVENGIVRSVQAENQGAETQFSITAGIFVDCTGDGRLGVEAGAPFMQGREGRDQFREPLAQPEPDNKTLGSTLLLQARKHDRPMPFIAPSWARQFRASDFHFRPFARPNSDLGLEYGYWWVEWGGCLDTVADSERIRDELLAIVMGVWDHIKNRSSADASHWALEWVGFLPGKRESRRFIGRHVLDEWDLRSSGPLADAIAYGGWPLDLHPPEGIDAPGLEPCSQHQLPFLYDIPLRSCISATISNLMFAGRNISATHVAFASTRVMATCAVVGQGVGTAAAVASRAAVTPGDIVQRPELVREIQQQLLKDDCYLIGVRNEDTRDLVLAADTITGSSAQPEAGPELIRSGQTRSVHGSDGCASGPRGPAGQAVGSKAGEDAVHQRGICAPPDRARPGLHRWMSDPQQGLPAWLQIDWKSPVNIREVILIFDTGLHRLLTLSQADGYTRKMLWGRPQPETVRDYLVELQTEAGWTEFARVTSNYQRRRVHARAAAMPATGLRITVTATQGIDHARICEVRAYA